jgi:hypothetical protein
MRWSRHGGAGEQAPDLLRLGNSAIGPGIDPSTRAGQRGIGGLLCRGWGAPAPV